MSSESSALSRRHAVALAAATLTAATVPMSVFFGQIFLFVTMWAGMPEWPKLWRSERPLAIAIGLVGASWVASWALAPRGIAAFYEAKDAWILGAAISVVALRDLWSRHRRIIMAGLALGMVSAGVLALIQAATGYDPVRGQTLIQTTLGFRPHGFYRSPMTLAGIITIGGFVAATRALHPTPTVPAIRLGWIALSALLLAALVVSNSRTYWLAVPGLALLVGVLYGRRGLFVAWTLIMIAGSALLLGPTDRIPSTTAQFDLNERHVFRVSFASNELNRVLAWKIGLDIARDYPLTGAGKGPTGYEGISTERARHTLQDHNIPAAFFTTIAGHSHNNAIQVLAETGIIGLGAFGWLVLVLLHRLGSAWRNGQFDDPTGPIILAGLGWLLLGPGCFEYNLGDMEFMLLVTLLVGVYYPRFSVQKIPAPAHHHPASTDTPAASATPRAPM